MAAATLTAATLVLPGVALAGASAPAPAATATGTVLKTRTISGTTVLTNAKGFTLYSFAPDTPTRSKCYGTRAAYWPPRRPVALRPAQPCQERRARASGTTATYNGHPLYTYIGDTAPGQDSGNHLNLNGGHWHVVPASP